MKYRIIIVELVIEGHSTGAIKQIMVNRRGIDVSKRGFRKLCIRYWRYL